MRDPICVEGWSCWRRAQARRVAFLVDGHDSFAAIASALEQAQRSILICGWDLHSSLRLRRDPSPHGEPETLAALLSWLVERRPRLQIHVLLWDFAMIFALEREVLPIFHLGWRTPRRVHFRLDGDHPVGASRHRKIVVVDDAVAFAGGLDLTARRFDDREHRPENPQRIDPWGRPYGPFHDVEMAVSGEAARALGDLVRERWQEVTGRRPAPVEEEFDPWPTGLACAVRDCPVAIARTEPAFEGAPEVREIERGLIDGIRAARRSIYLENQYLTSAAVGDALEASLRSPGGPEVIVVGPRHCSGWLEEATMGVLRAELLRRLRRADLHGRLHAYTPMSSINRDVEIQVHSKVTVIDQTLLRIGSANLSNRSMGFDSECDLILEAAGRADVESAIAGLRCDLVAEHLGVRAQTLAAAEPEAGSLAAAVEQLRGGDRTLVPLDAESSIPSVLLPPPSLADPERPIPAARLLEELLPSDPLETERTPARRIAAVVVVCLAGLAAWNLTGLERLLASDGLAAWLDPLRGGIASSLVWLAVYVVGGFAMVPVTALIAACGLLLGAWQGFLVALGGSLTSALAGYAAGHVLRRDAIRRLAGRRLNRLSRAFARGGVATVTALRLAPVAPFTVVNLVAGASRLAARDFLLGTALGMAPGILVLTLLADRALAAIRDPGALSAAILAAVMLGGALGLRWLRRATSDRAGRDASDLSSTGGR